jgi:hypothetical protein
VTSRSWWLCGLSAWWGELFDDRLLEGCSSLKASAGVVIQDPVMVNPMWELDTA